MNNDSISNTLAQITNGINQQFLTIKIENNNQTIPILVKLKQLGIIKNFRLDKGDYLKNCPALPRSGSSGQKIVLFLKYNQSKSNLTKIRRISKSSCRRYASYLDIKKTQKIFQIRLFHTPYGLLTDIEAIKKKIGGEILCIIEP
jgi:small subunit ribosomal protein S8